VVNQLLFGFKVEVYIECNLR